MWNKTNWKSVRSDSKTHVNKQNPTYITETITKTLFSRDTLYVSLKTINTQNQLLIAFMKYFFDNLNLSKVCYGAKLKLLMSQSNCWAIFFILARREKQYRWNHLHWLKGHSWQRGSFKYNLCSSTHTNFQQKSYAIKCISWYVGRDILDCQTERQFSG